MSEQGDWMDRWGSRLRRVPVVMVLCGLLLGLWGLRMPGPSGVVCDRSGEPTAALGDTPRPVYCQVQWPRPWAWRPQGERTFQLHDVAITSELCDRTPRGGVRFCHHITLVGMTLAGAGRQVTLPEFRAPLSGAVLTDQLQGFIAGEGSAHLSWRGDPALPLRFLTVILLLAVAIWGLWEVRWPPIPARDKD